MNNDPTQARAQEKERDKKQTEERPEAQRDRGGQPPAGGIELSTYPRRSSTGAVNQRLQQTTNTFSTGTNNRIPSLPPPPHQYNPQGQGSVSEWFKWAAGDR